MNISPPSMTDDHQNGSHQQFLPSIVSKSHPGLLPPSPNRSIQAQALSQSQQTRNAEPSTCNVLIMNLPFRVRWQDLKDLCRQAAPIKRADVALEIDGRSRGFGEVEVVTSEDARRVHDMFNNYDWQGRRLNVILLESNQAGTPISTLNRSQLDMARMIDPVCSQHASVPGMIQHPIHNMAHTASDRSHTQSVTPSHALYTQQQRLAATAILQSEPLDGRLLFVGNLPFSLQWQDLKDLLRPAGRVLRTDVAIAQDGRSRGWGTAMFATAEEAAKAIQMFDNTFYEGRQIRVRADKFRARPSVSESSLHMSSMTAGMPMPMAMPGPMSGLSSPSSVTRLGGGGHSHPYMQQHHPFAGFQGSMNHLATEFMPPANYSNQTLSHSMSPYMSDLTSSMSTMSMSHSYPSNSIYALPNGYTAPNHAQSQTACYMQGTRTSPQTNDSWKRGQHGQHHADHSHPLASDSQKSLDFYDEANFSPNLTGFVPTQQHSQAPLHRQPGDQQQQQQGEGNPQP